MERVDYSEQTEEILQGRLTMLNEAALHIGENLDLMWIPFETTTFRDGIVTGTLESPPLFRNAITLGLFWDLH